MHTIALIGLGRMGTPVAARLCRAGHLVRAADLRPHRRDVALGIGARWAADAVTAATGADLLVTVLPGAPDVTAAVTDPVLDALAPGACWIDLSSCAPTDVAGLRTRALTRGVGVLDAPMGGSPDDAAAGLLRLFVGGPAELLDRQRPLLSLIADRITRMGDHGAGYTTKLLVNLLWFGQAAATAEALLLGQATGIDPRALGAALATSAAASDFVRRDLPALLDGDYYASYGLDRIRDQLAAVTALAERLGTPHPIADTVAALHQQALDRFGPVDGELLAVALLEERAGARLGPPETGRPAV